MRPAELDSPIPDEEAVLKYRNLWCRDYDACLDIVAGEGWKGWSCASCENFKQAAPDDVPNHAQKRSGD